MKKAALKPFACAPKTPPVLSRDELLDALDLRAAANSGVIHNESDKESCRATVAWLMGAPPRLEEDLPHMSAVGVAKQAQRLRGALSRVVSTRLDLMPQPKGLPTAERMHRELAMLQANGKLIERQILRARAEPKAAVDPTHDPECLFEAMKHDCQMARVEEAAKRAIAAARSPASPPVRPEVSRPSSAPTRKRAGVAKPRHHA